MLNSTNQINNKHVQNDENHKTLRLVAEKSQENKKERKTKTKTKTASNFIILNVKKKIIIKQESSLVE